MSILAYSTSDGRKLYRVDTWVTYADGTSKRIRKSRIPTKPMAIAYEQKLKASAFEGVHFGRPKARMLTVGKACEAFAPTSKLAKRSWQTDEGRAKHLVTHLGDKRCEVLTQRDVDQYRTARLEEKTVRGKAPAVGTLNREVAILRHVLNHAVKCGDLDRNPLVGVKMLDEDNVRDMIIGDTEFATLYECAEAPLKPILLMAFDTGMRKREILDLRWEQVNLKEGTVRLGACDTKGKHPRVIMLTSRVRDTLEAMKKDTPTSISGYVFVNPAEGKPWNQIKKVFHRARKDAGLHKLWFHDLRRSFITNARRCGVAESVVMKMSGHRTQQVFKRYNIIDDGDLRAAVTAIEVGSAAERGENATAAVQEAK